MTLSRFVRGAMAPVLAAVLSLVITGIVLRVTGNNPLDVFELMWSFGTRRESIVDIVNRATPLYISGLAVAIGFKMNLFNIGVDGQYRIAVLIAASVGAAISLPPVIHVPIIIVTAMAVGAMWAGIAGVLLVKRGVSVVISTIMLNTIATGVGAFLLTNYLKADNDQSLLTKTPELPASAHIPSLNRVVEWFGFDLSNTRANLFGAVILAMIVGLAYHVLLNRTRFGYELRVTGLNPEAARVAGIDPKKMMLRTMLISGGVAGLVGLPHLLGQFHEYRDANFPSDLGFDGLAVALLGRNHPVGVAVGALTWGFLERSGSILAVEGLSPEIVKIMQGTILLTVVIGYSVAERSTRAARVREAAARTVEAMLAEASDDEEAVLS
jgi:ABC-type uncharacterized transport system permease subunit